MKITYIIINLLNLFTMITPLSVNSIYMQQYKHFINKYNKTFSYENFYIFKNNVKYIESFHNNLFDIEINKFTDTNIIKNNMINHNNNHNHNNEIINTFNNHNLPDSVNWVKREAVTDVKDQGQCGSCWAFSATGGIEGAYAIKYNKLVNVSEQELVDCSGNEGNQGCFGGLMDDAFQFVIDNNGLCLETGYPYVANQNQCNETCNNLIQISNYSNVPPNNETILMNAVAHQPISIAIQANLPSFQFYSKGIYNDSECNGELDHGVLLVGYGVDDNNISYWLIKNSWGSDWGENGYIRMIRNVNKNSSGMCGLTKAASFPII